MLSKVGTTVNEPSDHKDRMVTILCRTSFRRFRTNRSPHTDSICTWTSVGWQAMASLKSAHSLYRRNEAESREMSVLEFSRSDEPVDANLRWQNNVGLTGSLWRCTGACCVDGFAFGYVRMGVGLARIHLACESINTGLLYSCPV